LLKTCFAEEFDFPERAAKDYCTIIAALNQYSYTNSEDLVELPVWFAEQEKLTHANGFVTMGTVEDWLEKIGVDGDKFIHAESRKSPASTTLFIGSWDGQEDFAADLLAKVMAYYHVQTPVTLHVVTTPEDGSSMDFSAVSNISVTFLIVRPNDVQFALARQLDIPSLLPPDLDDDDSPRP